MTQLKLMTKEEAINILIKETNTNEISDGYHTFGELYEHRIQLFITLCKLIAHSNYGAYQENPVWKSKKHSNGTSFEGWFILGIDGTKGKQITYHLPVSKWDECSFADELPFAPEWDGHTSVDVLQRLKQL